MERFFTFEKAPIEAVEGGDYELIGGRVTEDATVSSRDLLRPTPVSGRDVYIIFWF